jgi:hypothetical protein
MRPNSASLSDAYLALRASSGAAKRGRSMLLRKVLEPACFMFAALAAGSAYGQNVQGTVFEVVDSHLPQAEWRRVPSADAFVIVHWTGSRPGFGHYESVCLQAAIGKTDERGRFSISEPPPLHSTLMVFRDTPAVAVYKPGFDTPPKRDIWAPQSEWSLLPTKLSREQRAIVAESLLGLGCRDGTGRLIPLTDPQGVLPALRRAVLEESPPKPESPMQVDVLPRSGPLRAAPPR